MTKLLSEIFDEIEACTIQEDIIKVIKKYDSPSLRWLLFFTFCDLKFDVDIPEWTPCNNPIGLTQNSLFKEARRIYIFAKPELSAKQKSDHLKNMLETMHVSDAELLLQVLKKDVGIPLLTKELVMYTYGVDKI
jgi:hypothetical protein